MAPWALKAKGRKAKGTPSALAVVGIDETGGSGYSFARVVRDAANASNLGNPPVRLQDKFTPLGWRLPSQGVSHCIHRRTISTMMPANTAATTSRMKSAMGITPSVRDLGDCLPILYNRGETASMTRDAPEMASGDAK